MKRLKKFTSRFSLQILCTGILLLMLTPAAMSENRFMIEDTNIPLNSTGNIVRLLMDSDQSAHGISIYLEFNPSVLQLRSVSLGEDAALAAPDWFDGTIDNVNGNVRYGMLFGLSLETIANRILPGTGIEVLLLEFDSVASSTGSSTVDLLDIIDGPPPDKTNVITDANGFSINPTLVDGAISFIDLSPVIESFSGNTGTEGTQFQIVGQNFDQTGLRVEICGTDVVPTLLGDQVTLEVTAPACTPGPATVEVFNSFGSDSDPAGFTYEPEPQPMFRRGRVNGDAQFNISDCIFILIYKFDGGSEPECLDAADVDNDGMILINDASYIINYLFREGDDPGEPFQNCGVDTIDVDALTCETVPPECQ